MFQKYQDLFNQFVLKFGEDHNLIYGHKQVSKFCQLDKIISIEPTEHGVKFSFMCEQNLDKFNNNYIINVTAETNQKSVYIDFK